MLYVLILLYDLASYQPVTFDTLELCQTARAEMIHAGHIQEDRVICARVK